MYPASQRPSRAEIGAEFLLQPGWLSRAVAEASDSWLQMSADSLKDSEYIRGLVAYLHLQRGFRHPAFWSHVYSTASDAIDDAFEHDAAWAGEVLQTLPATVKASNANLVGLAELGMASEDTLPHISSKVYLDAYLDLFEGCLPPLAQFLLPLLQAKSPTRRLPSDLMNHDARELFEMLAHGRVWKGMLLPFDPFYRNAIAHRSAAIAPDGSVVVSPLDDTASPRHLSRPHLISLLQDAIAVVQALTAALELCNHHPGCKFPMSSIEAREAMGFAVVHAGQAVDQWEEPTKGMLTVGLAGRRCEELLLLQAMMSAVRLFEEPPSTIFIRYKNRKGEERGFWALKQHHLELAQESIEGLKAAVEASESRQLRL